MDDNLYFHNLVIILHLNSDYSMDIMIFLIFFNFQIVNLAMQNSFCFLREITRKFL